MDDELQIDYRHFMWKGDPLEFPEWGGAEVGEPLPGTSFVVGAPNDAEAIASLRDWRGYDRSVQLARTEGLPPFLGQTEDLVDLLTADMELVKELGTSHDVLSSVYDQTVNYVMRRVGANGGSKEPIIIPMQDREIEANVTIGTHKMEFAPLPLATPSRITIEVRRRGHDEAILLTEMAGDLAHLYGFYEGMRAHYRTDPRKACTIYRD
tara:strand:- start:45 stop:671 length:627 start_codon:yes stop_codon:yes gene_type:complete